MARSRITGADGLKQRWYALLSLAGLQYPADFCYCMNAVRTSGCAAWSEGFFGETVGIVPGERVVTMAGSFGLWEQSAVLC